MSIISTVKRRGIVQSILSGDTMTVILIHSAADHAFMAADSCRWDLVRNKNLGPVVKLHTTGLGAALAMGGINIDRSQLATKMIAAKREGVHFATSARELSPHLFRATAELQKKYGRNDAQFLAAWYAECNGTSCSVKRHTLPQDLLADVHGFDAMGPDSAWLQMVAEHQKHQLTSVNGELQLDLWAYRVIQQASLQFPTAVALPAIAAILRPTSPEILRNDLDPRVWSGPNAVFSAKI
jgi:hypothetical protein